jgi:3-methylcrotonyl-CoA carboxylase alpha subunit
LRVFNSVLIANRGEIAVRVARTAKRMGLRTIAVYSDADAGALHVGACDEAYAIGPAPARDSYLAIDKIIAVARRARADCVHPGYGFLSENPEFADACATAGIVFIGPSAAAMRAMGLKDRAKALMAKAGVPVVPGYHGERQEAAFLREKSYELGYPVLIKAVAGGGGKGMRRVEKHAEFDAALEGAQREASASFGDARVLIEKYIAAPRHIEMQVFGDSRGNVVHLNERDCSLQRRHQKVIEEAPAPGMTPDVRAAMGRAAVEAARAVQYVGAGTVEFIADGSRGLRSDGFWFMEMNTRLQVEHPVTEAITGLDLVEWQFRVAAGEALPKQQGEIKIDGHGVEARLYAEDPEHGFLPSSGKLLAFETASGVRVDTGVATGQAVTPFYDAMIAKIIAHAPTRDAAFDKLANALAQTLVVGPRSNAAFLEKLLRSEKFRAGQFDTGFIDQNATALGAVPQPIDNAAAARGVAELLVRQMARLATRSDDHVEVAASPWDARDGFQLTGERVLELPIDVDGHTVRAQVSYGPAEPSVTVGGEGPAQDGRVVAGEGTVYVVRGGRQTVVAFADAGANAGDAAAGGGVLRAPMHGKVIAVFVEKGEAVRKGQRLAIIEAMKMEHALLAPFDGTVAEVAASAGSQIAEKAPVLRIEPEA